MRGFPAIQRDRVARRYYERVVGRRQRPVVEFFERGQAQRGRGRRQRRRPDDGHALVIAGFRDALDFNDQSTVAVGVHRVRQVLVVVPPFYVVHVDVQRAIEHHLVVQRRYQRFGRTRKIDSDH